MSPKDQTYLNALKETKFNQTEAYLKTYPNSKYNSARANSVRKTKTLIANDSIQSLLDLADNKVQEFLSLPTKTIKDKKSQADIAIQLSKRQVADKVHNINEDIEKEQVNRALSRYTLS